MDQTSMQQNTENIEEKYLEKYHGTWLVDKSLSDDAETYFKFRGINWPTRKLINLATIRMHMSSYRARLPETPTPVQGSSEVREPPLCLESQQFATGGLTLSTEIRTLDSAPYSVSYKVYGSGQLWSRLVTGGVALDGSGTGVVRPQLEIATQIQDERIGKFLRAEIMSDGAGCEGWLVEEGDGEQGMWVHFCMVGDDKERWVVEGVWGFEMVDGKRCQTRRHVTSNAKGQHMLARMVLVQEK